MARGDTAGGSGAGGLKSLLGNLPGRNSLGIDVPLLLIVLTLVIFGMLMVFSASWDFSYRIFNDPAYTFRRQLTWLVLGIGGSVVLSMMKYQWWTRLSLPVMVLTIGALAAVLLLRDDRFGASRTLAGGSYQPSELAKLMVVVYLSVWLSNRRSQLKDVWFGLVPLGTILGIVGGLIVIQPDLSATITVMMLGGILFFLAGGDLRQIAILLAVGFLIGYIIVASPLFPTGSQRFTDFIAGIQDLMKSSEHVRRSIEAFVRGGWFGVGIGRGQTKLTGLPFPHTDSIFAVVGEETGVLGSVFLVALYVGLLWRGLVIARNARDGLGRLLAGGLTFWIVLEATINMAVMVGLLPFAGNALPLISSGGSSLVVTLAALGIVMSVARQSETKKELEERSFDAVVDLRRWNRRRRVSGAGGAASAGIRRR